MGWKFSALAVFLFFASFLAAAEPDSYDYAKFNERALKELNALDEFYEDLFSKPGSQKTAFGFWPVDSEDQIPKAKIMSAREGIFVLRACVRSASGRTDKIKEVWDKILSTSVTTARFECPIDIDSGGSAISEAGAALVASRSNLNIRVYAAFNDEGYYYLPTLSALIQTYRTKGIFSDPVMEERIANTNHMAARLRKTLGETNLDFMYLKNRYGSDPEIRPFIAESMLSKEDREGIRLLARCINAPLAAMVAYARIPAIPEEAILRKHFGCLSSSPLGLASGWDPSVKLDELKANFAIASKSALGQNVFMVSEKPGGTSLALDSVRGSDEKERLTARLHLLLTDRFVNQEVPALRKSLSKRYTYKGIGSLDAVNRYLLTDVLQQKYNIEFSDKIQDLAFYKAFLDAEEGALSCLVDKRNSVAAAAAGEKLAGMVKLGGSTAGKVMKPLGMAIAAGFAVYAWNKAASEHKKAIEDFVNGKSTIAQGILEACKLVSDGLDIKSTMKSYWSSRWGSNSYLEGIGSKGYEGLNGFSESQTKESVKVAVSTYLGDSLEGKSTAKSEAAVDWNKLYDRRKESENSRLVARQSPAATLVFSYFGAVPRARVWLFDDAGKPDPVSSYTLYLIKRALVFGSGLDLTQPLVEKYSPDLKALRQQSKSSDANAASKANAELIAKKKEALADLFDASFADERVFMLESANGVRFVYVSKNPSETGVPAEVEVDFKRFVKSMKAAGLDDVALLPHPENYYLGSLSDYAAAATSPLKEEKDRFALLRDFLSPVRTLGFGAKSESRAKQIKKSMMDGIKATLSADRSAAFDDVFKTVFDPEKLEEKQGGVALALSSRKEKILAKTKGYDGQYAGKLLLLFDSRLSKLDAFGTDAPLALSMVSGSSFGEKDSAAFSDYLGKVAVGMLSSPRLWEAGQSGGPFLSDLEFSVLFKEYALLSPEQVALFSEINQKFPAAFLVALRKASKKEGLTSSDIKSVVGNLKTERDGRPAYLVSASLRSGEKVEFVLEAGVFGEKETAVRNAWSKAGAFPETYSRIAKGNFGVTLEEAVDGPTMEDFLLSAKSPDKGAAFVELAQLDGLLVSSTFVRDTGKATFVLPQDLYSKTLSYRKKPVAGSKNSGRAVLGNYDPNVATLREPGTGLYLLLLLRDIDFSDQDFAPYLKKLHETIRTELGAEGNSLFIEALKEARTGFEKSPDSEWFKRFSNANTLDGTLASKTALGSPALLGRVVGAQAAAKLGVPVPDESAYERLFRYSDSYLKSVGVSD